MRRLAMRFANAEVLAGLLQYNGPMRRSYIEAMKMIATDLEMCNVATSIS